MQAKAVLSSTPQVSRFACLVEGAPWRVPAAATVLDVQNPWFAGSTGKDRQMSADLTRRLMNQPLPNGEVYRYSGVARERPFVLGPSRLFDKS